MFDVSKLDTRVFEALERDGHEAMLFAQDSRSGLRAIIAIHSTVAGPAVGGTRMRKYASEREALLDALRLSRDMTYKAAIHRLPLGGGKAVILGDPRQEKTPALLRAYGRAVDGLGGRYIASEDSGIGSRDLEVIAQATPHVTTLAGAPGTMADPPFATAHGVVVAIRTVARLTLDREDLAGVRVAVQGAGAVGSWVCRLLAREGASVELADVDPQRGAAVAEEIGARVVSPRSVVSAACDVFSPCALGGVIDEQVADRLRCRGVAGAANNVLTSPAVAERLHHCGILYAPDFVASSGGMVQEGGLREGWSHARIAARIDQIGPILEETVKRAADGDTHTAAVRLARERLG
jgi:leucine dehydrogenase